MGESVSAYQRAVNELSERVSAACASGSCRVPPVGELARAARVSQATMLKALAWFRDQGVVTTSRGRGTHVVLGLGQAATPTAQDAPIRRGPRWQRLASRLRHDILHAHYAPGSSFPSRKELAAEFGVCHRTLCKALDSLVADGILEEHGRSCRVPLSGGGGRGGKRVVLIVRGDSFGDPEPYSSRTQEQLRHLETECVRAGVRLQLATCHFIGLDMVGLDRIEAMVAGRGGEGDILGFVVWTMGLREDFIEKLFALLAGARAPTAVFDEVYDLSLPSIPGAERMRLFRMALDSYPGRAVGEYLIKLGHRKVAFITHEPSAIHVAQRFAGVRQAFFLAGIPDAVTLYDASTYPDAQGDTGEPPDFLALLEHVLPGYAGFPTEAFSVRERIPVWFANQLAEAPRLAQRRDQLFALLEELEKDGGYTAWVGDSDPVALGCLDFLQLKSVQGVSVVGFDDGFGAFLRRLTTYNFNGEAYMRAIIDHVVSPLGQHPLRRTGDPTVFRGHMVERWSAGPPGR